MGSHSTHSHSHSHSHAPGQAHSHRHDTNEQRMGLAALLTGLFMGAEIAGGIVSGLGSLPHSAQEKASTEMHVGRDGGRGISSR